MGTAKTATAAVTPQAQPRRACVEVDEPNSDGDEDDIIQPQSTSAELRQASGAVKRRIQGPDDDQTAKKEAPKASDNVASKPSGQLVAGTSKSSRVASQQHHFMTAMTDMQERLQDRQHAFQVNYSADTFSDFLEAVP